MQVLQDQKRNAVQENNCFDKFKSKCVLEDQNTYPNKNLKIVLKKQIWQNFNKLENGSNKRSANKCNLKVKTSKEWIVASIK